MVDTVTIVIQAVMFGYDKYGLKGAVAAAVAVGASYVLIMRIIPRVTDVDEEEVEAMYDRINEDDELTDILGEEFNKRFGKYLESG